ncbi:Hypothetical protein SMAX5B_007140 [Scophthalmus maximus]|uniref:Uncharacterized protein n=1 Tax=Scophthalmus maximus TaxID=52904 RepID=A0A2U9BXT1_SCOMX|nr:Hypothetical protein SMAX5B_007140 [Scophthalmus maximus]KAF0022216.1 hypothetical protein F2P81_025533 [Scophthalmus maximus]
MSLREAAAAGKADAPNTSAERPAPNGTDAPELRSSLVEGAQSQARHTEAGPGPEMIPEPADLPASNESLTPTAATSSSVANVTAPSTSAAQPPDPQTPDSDMDLVQIRKRHNTDRQTRQGKKLTKSKTKR